MYCLFGIRKSLLTRVLSIYRAATLVHSFVTSLTQLMHDNLHWLDVPERINYSHHLDSSLPHRYRASVSSYRLCSFLPRWHRDVIYAPPLVISLSCSRTVWTHEAFGRFLYSVRDYGTLCLDSLLRDTIHNTTSFGHPLKTFFLSEY